MKHISADLVHRLNMTRHYIDLFFFFTLIMFTSISSSQTCHENFLPQNTSFFRFEKERKKAHVLLKLQICALNPKTTYEDCSNKD